MGPSIPAPPAPALQDQPALWPEESTFRQLFQSAPVGLRLLDARGLTVSANSRLGRILGREVASLVGRPALQDVAAEQIPALQEAWGRRLAGLSETLLCRFLRPDGQEVEAIVASSPRTDPQGRMVGAIEVVTVLAESDPAGKAAGFNPVGDLDLLNDLPFGLWVTDARDALVLANAALPELTGLRRGAGSGPDLWAAFPEGVAGRLRPLFLQARETLCPVRFEALPVAVPAARSLLIAGWLIPRLRQGTYLGMIGLVSDVTAQQGEEAVRRGQRDHLRLLLEHLPVPLMVWNLQGRIIQANRAFETWSGYRAAEVVGREVNTLFPAGAPREWPQRLEAAARSGAVSELPCDLLGQDGQPRAVLWRAAAIPSLAGGTVLAFVAVGRNQAEAGAVTGAPPQRMESTPAVVTSAPAPPPEPVAEAPRGRSRKRLLGGVSSGLRNPANVAAGAADLLYKHFDQLGETRRRELLELVRNSVRRISAAMEDLEWLERAQADELVCAPQPTDLPALVREIIQEVQAADVARHPISFQSHWPGSVTRLDGKLLRPVLGHLLANAIHYSPPCSPVTLTLTAAADSLLLSVEDQGVGVPLEDQTRIFEVFERGSNVGEVPGMGLGLALAKSLVVLQKGRLTCESRVGVGSRFLIRLPLLP